MDATLRNPLCATCHEPILPDQTAAVFPDFDATYHIPDCMPA